MSESHSDFSLSRRRMLGLGVAAIPAVMLLGAGTAVASPARPAQPVATAGASAVATNAQPCQAVYFC
jgi:nitrous oxide reductase